MEVLRAYPLEVEEDAPSRPIASGIPPEMAPRIILSETFDGIPPTH